MNKVLIVFLFSISIVTAQEKQTYHTMVQLSAGGSGFTKMTTEDRFPFIVPIPQISVAVEHGLSTHISTGVMYANWLVSNKRVIYADVTGDLDDWKGQIAGRSHSQNLDVFGKYSFDNGIYAGMGITHLWGIEYYVSNTYQHPGYPDVRIWTEQRKANYTG